MGNLVSLEERIEAKKRMSEPQTEFYWRMFEDACDTVEHLPRALILKLMTKCRKELENG